jgi:hypothetical protein
MAIDPIPDHVLTRRRGRRQMCDDLVTEQVEIDPVAAAAPFGTPEYLTIKMAGFAQVIDGKGNVKGCQHQQTPSRSSIYLIIPWRHLKIHAKEP